MCGSLSITTPVSLLANELVVQSVLHGQMRLAAVNQIYVLHEAMNGCKNLKIHFIDGWLRMGLLPPLGNFADIS